jgi:hypothetical protein
MKKTKKASSAQTKSSVKIRDLDPRKSVKGGAAALGDLNFNGK